MEDGEGKVLLQGPLGKDAVRMWQASQAYKFIYQSPHR